MLLRSVNIATMSARCLSWTPRYVAWSFFSHSTWIEGTWTRCCACVGTNGHFVSILISHCSELPYFRWSVTKNSASQSTRTPISYRCVCSVTQAVSLQYHQSKISLTKFLSAALLFAPSFSPDKLMLSCNYHVILTEFRWRCGGCLEFGWQWKCSALNVSLRAVSLRHGGCTCYRALGLLTLFQFTKTQVPNLCTVTLSNTRNPPFREVYTSNLTRFCLRAQTVLTESRAITKPRPVIICLNPR